MIKTLRKPYRIKRLKSIFGNRFFWLGVLFFVSIAAISYFLFFSEFFQIKEIKISGNQKVLTEDLKNIIQDQIDQKIFIFSNKSIFLVNLNKTNKIILEKFPQIAEVNLKRDFPDILILEVRERIPIGIWCQNSNCSSIDQEGIIFEEGFQEGKLVIESQEQKPKVSLGERVIEKEDLNLILEIQKKLRKNLEIDIEKFSIISSERLNAKTSEGWEIYFNPKGDLNWQITELGVVLEKHIPLQRRGELKYIDLRFSKVFIYPEFK